MNIWEHQHHRREAAAGESDSLSVSVAPAVDISAVDMTVVETTSNPAAQLPEVGCSCRSSDINRLMLNNLQTHQPSACCWSTTARSQQHRYWQLALWVSKQPPVSQTVVQLFQRSFNLTDHQPQPAANHSVERSASLLHRWSFAAVGNSTVANHGFYQNADDRLLWLTSALGFNAATCVYQQHRHSMGLHSSNCFIVVSNNSTEIIQLHRYSCI